MRSMFARSETELEQLPMYCKSKVYSGSHEFCFEELRGLHWFERKRAEERQRRDIEVVVNDRVEQIKADME